MADRAICSVSSWLAARSCGVICTQCIAWRRSYLFQVIVWPCLCLWCTSLAAAVMLHHHDLSQLFVPCGYTAALVDVLKRYAHTALLLHPLDVGSSGNGNYAKSYTQSISTCSHRCGCGGNACLAFLHAYMRYILYTCQNYRKMPTETCAVCKHVCIHKLQLQIQMHVHLIRLIRSCDHV